MREALRRNYEKRVSREKVAALMRENVLNTQGKKKSPTINKLRDRHSSKAVVNRKRDVSWEKTCFENVRNLLEQAGYESRSKS
jgi:hypothetical protein